MEILFPFQNSDKIMLYHTALFECNIPHVKFSAYFLSHLCIGSQLTSQNTHFFSQTLHRFFFFFWIKIQFPFQTLAKFMYFIYPINFTRPLSQISNHFQS